jgi:hypothetical protein
MKSSLLITLCLLMSVCFCRAQQAAVCSSFAIIQDLSSKAYHPYDTMKIVLRNASHKSATYAMEVYVQVDSQWRNSYTFTKYYNRLIADTAMERIFAPENKGVKYTIPQDFHIPSYTIKADTTATIRFIVGHGAFNERMLKFRFTIYDEDLNRCYLFSSPFVECKIL